MKFRSLLIANRGEIALRVMRTAKRMGLRTVAVYSDADRDAPHVRAANMAVHIGGSAPRASYLNTPALLAAAKTVAGDAHAADAIHPGYGFLSESPAFAEAVQKAGLVWVGPPPASMRALGDKQGARRLARKLGLPVLPGYDEDDQSDARLGAAAKQIGFPLMIKASAGGGGRGMRLVRSEAEFAEALAAARSEANHAFGDDRLLLEKAVEGGRHIEVQVFADAHGNIVHLGERDCSVQRRHQKLIEESPSPVVDAKKRESLGQAAIAIARAAGYTGAGTVEFLRDSEGCFWFLEVNTRLQVEHAVTEMVTGLDLVEWQLRVAAGEALPLKQDQIRFQGHAIEARLCAEDPTRNHLPDAGRLALWRAPEGVRTDHALESGIEITPHYDSLIAKLIAHAPTRDEARAKLRSALESTVALGIRTNRWFLSVVVQGTEFGERGATTAILDDFHPATSISLGWHAAALATAIATETEGRKAGHGERTAWSNNPERVLRRRLLGSGFSDDVLLRHQHGVYRVEARNISLALRVRSIAENVATLEIEGAGQQAIPCCVHGNFIYLALFNRDWIFEDTTRWPPERRRQTGGAYDGVRSPMNGRIVAVHAKAGDQVAEGSVLVVMEAMKMEHQLVAPGTVRVKAVHVAPGMQVAPGKLLVEFEPAKAA